MNLLRVVLAGVLAAGSAVWAQQHETVRVQTGKMERHVRLPAEFLPYQSVDVHARVPGFVEKLNVDRGSMVKTGQVLAVLSAPEMAAQIAEAEAKTQQLEAERVSAEARLIGARSTYERMKEASETPGAIAGNELLLAEKAVDAADAAVNAAELSVRAAKASVQAIEQMSNYLTVTAPFDGVITERLAHPGALAGPNSGAASQPLFRLEQISRLRLVVAVPEGGVDGIVRGARVAFNTPAFPGQTFHGTVARIARSMEGATRTMPVELDVLNPRGRLAPGMYAEVQWPVHEKRNSVMVPSSSIAVTTERSFVIRVADGRAEWVNVRRGLASGDMVEVFGNLKPGDVILKRASDEIREGAPLQVAEGRPE